MTPPSTTQPQFERCKQPHPPIIHIRVNGTIPDASFPLSPIPCPTTPVALDFPIIPCTNDWLVHTSSRTMGLHPLAHPHNQREPSHLGQAAGLHSGRQLRGCREHAKDSPIAQAQRNLAMHSQIRMYIRDVHMNKKDTGTRQIGCAQTSDGVKRDRSAPCIMARRG